jgi:hypothetical protein
MAAIDMPATPANPSTYAASNGVTYVWDGQKWSATGGGSDAGAGISVGTNPPTSKKEGDLWYNTVDGIMYVWYVDESQVAGAGEGQWVDARPGGEGVA